MSNTVPEGNRNLPTTPIHYTPALYIAGAQHYVISDIMVALTHVNQDDKVRAIVEEALSKQPEGYELRNEYLLRLREALQSWRSLGTMAGMVKLLLTRVLDDTVDGPGNKFPAHKLKMNTAIAYDPARMRDEAVREYGE